MKRKSIAFALPIAFVMALSSCNSSKDQTISVNTEKSTVSVEEEMVDNVDFGGLSFEMSTKWRKVNTEKDPKKYIRYSGTGFSFSAQLLQGKYVDITSDTLVSDVESTYKQLTIKEHNIYKVDNIDCIKVICYDNEEKKDFVKLICASSEGTVAFNFTQNLDPPDITFLSKQLDDFSKSIKNVIPFPENNSEESLSSSEIVAEPDDNPSIIIPPRFEDVEETESVHGQYDYYKQLEYEDDKNIYIFGKIDDYFSDRFEYARILTDDGVWFVKLSSWNTPDTRFIKDLIDHFPKGTENIYFFGKYDKKYNDEPVLNVYRIRYKEKWYDNDSFYHYENVLTSEQSHALTRAKRYLDVSAFSRQSLIEQLEYEGIATDDAIFAVDRLKIDWNEQAVKRAKSYTELKDFSYEELISQLEYEGFTHDEAVYGVDNMNK